MMIYMSELFIPLILSNVLHMIVVKLDLFKTTKKPIHPQIFGPNKTYRGFYILISLTSIFQYFISGQLRGEFHLSYLFLGAMLGFTYALFELPNSLYKRSRGIAAGEAPRSLKYILLDKIDSTFGVSLVYVLYQKLEFSHFLGLFLGAFIIHLSLSYMLKRIKLKESL